MRELSKRNTSRQQNTEKQTRSESAVATIWLVFYMLALGVAIASPLVSHALDVAGR